MSYLYDAAGRRERMSWPDGNYVTYDWNVASQLTHIRENGASSGLGVLAAFTYDDQGRRTALIRGNGTQTSYSFDAAGRLASLVEDLSGTSHDLTVSFDHNHSGQIIERTVSNASYTYAHSITIDTLFDHNGLNQITSADDGTSVLTPTYDARGNLTAYDGRTFGYDTYNRLTSVGGTGGSMSLDYDPLGRLWETSGPSGTARYQYDGAAIIAEYNASGVMQHRWVHGPGMDEPLVRYDGSGMTSRTWLHADERGSIIAHTDSAGARTQLNTYDAFGNPGASNAGLFQYTGQVWLEDAGVYYYKNRTYHAELGVFMQADPIGHSGGVNLYAYVGGDPVNFSDPWGLVKCDSNSPPSCRDIVNVRASTTHWYGTEALLQIIIDWSRFKSGAKARSGRNRPNCASIGAAPPTGAVDLGLREGASIEEIARAFAQTDMARQAYLAGVTLNQEIGGLFVLRNETIHAVGSVTMGRSGGSVAVRRTLLRRGDSPLAAWHTHGRFDPENSVPGPSFDDVEGEMEVTIDNWAAVYGTDGSGAGARTAQYAIGGGQYLSSTVPDVDPVANLSGVEEGLPGSCR